MRRFVRVVVVGALAGAMVAGGANAASAAKPGSTSTSCSKRNPCTTADTTAPVVSITSPTGGATVGGTVQVAGSSLDNVGVSRVEVQVDGGASAVASGTSSWAVTVDTTALPDGSHTFTARAVDAAGNTSAAGVTVVVANATSDPTPPTVTDAGTAGDVTIDDPKAMYELLPLGRTRLPQWGSLRGVLYTEQFTNRRAVAFRNADTGATSYVDLPADSSAGWTNAASVMTSARDLWVFGGTGPMVARHYLLDDTAMPTSAQLVESRVLGDSDSREGDAVALQSGGVVFTWGQQGATGPQGLFVAYRSPAGNWQLLPAMTFAPSFASDEVLGQHPTDGSIWLFVSPDAWGAIGAAHLTETDASLRVDWTDGQYLNPNRDGLNGPDPENPNLALAADPATGSLALAYQSADRRYFTSGSTTRVGSRIAVARIPATGAPSFLVLPVWAERVSAVGLVVEGGDTVVSYRPIDEVTLAFDQVLVSRHHDGAWQPAVTFGRITSTDRVTFAAGRAELSTKLDDGRIHRRTF